MRAARTLVFAAALVGSVAAALAAVPPLRLCADPANLPFSSNAPGAPGRPILELLAGSRPVTWMVLPRGEGDAQVTCASATSIA